ncbi:hypothetical protein NPIL_88521 [Nephila pilipes]|uniref:Uncharacterized protein n=1 Tax=Nephila pilipes TaxID=299642 RepID=A0A8X6QIW2_NEPPI|nr:hypothetical protein NPIL_88521 [Nephila pilipes]
MCNSPSFFVKEAPLGQVLPKEVANLKLRPDLEALRTQSKSRPSPPEPITLKPMEMTPSFPTTKRDPWRNLLVGSQSRSWNQSHPKRTCVCY